MFRRQFSYTTVKPRQFKQNTKQFWRKMEKEEHFLERQRRPQLFLSDLWILNLFSTITKLQQKIIQRQISAARIFHLFHGGFFIFVLLKRRIILSFISYYDEFAAYFFFNFFRHAFNSSFIFNFTKKKKRETLKNVFTLGNW